MPSNSASLLYEVPRNIKGCIECASIASDATTTVNLTTIAAIDTPTGLAVTKTGSGSSTWGYRVAALTSGGKSIACAEVTVGSQNATLSASAYNTLTWDAVEDATGYEIWRSSVGTSPSTQGLIGIVGNDAVTFVDTGNALIGPAIAFVPAANTSHLGQPNNVNHITIYNTGSFDLRVRFPQALNAEIAARVANATLTASVSDATFSKRLVVKTNQYRQYDFTQARQWICLRGVGGTGSCEIEVA